MSMIFGFRTARGLISSAEAVLRKLSTHLGIVSTWNGTVTIDVEVSTIPTLCRNQLKTFEKWLTEARWCANHRRSKLTNLKKALTKPLFSATMNSPTNITAEYLQHKSRSVFMAHPVLQYNVHIIYQWLSRLRRRHRRLCVRTLRLPIALFIFCTVPVRLPLLSTASSHGDGRKKRKGKPPFWIKLNVLVF